MNPIKKQPLVSIIIPAYNVQNSVARAIESVLAQTYSHVEIIVIDDGSSDNTVNVCISFGDRIRYIHQDNQGVSAARNRGIRDAKGEWIGFLDADDWYLPNKVESLLSELNVFPEAKCITGADYVTTDKNESTTLRRLPFRNKKRARYINLIRMISFNLPAIHTNTSLIHKNVFSEVGTFEEKWKFGEDLEMWIRIAGKYDWLYVDTPVSVYNWGGSQTSVCKAAKASEEGIAYLYSIDEIKLNLPESLKADYKRWGALTLLRQAKNGCIQGDMEFAKTCLRPFCGDCINHTPVFIFPKLVDLIKFILRIKIKLLKLRYFK